MCFKSILWIYFFYAYFGISIVIANTGCPLVSVSECINICKNVLEDEIRIRTSIHKIADQLAQKDNCENPIRDVKGKTHYKPITNCAEWQKLGKHASGQYTVYPSSANGTKIKVYCDLKTDGGGWIVIQRRVNYTYPGSNINFSRNFNEYRKGFGNILQEFWLGNDNIHMLTTQEEVELRFEFKHFYGHYFYAEYDKLKVMDATSNFTLLLGDYSGNTSVEVYPFLIHNNSKFYTYDRGLHTSQTQANKGGWWFNDWYYRTNINGVYEKNKNTGKAEGIDWNSWPGNFMETEMKIRPRYFLAKHKY